MLRETVPGGPRLAWAVLAGSAGVLGLVCFYAALAAGVMSLVAPVGAVIAAGLPVAFGLFTGDRLDPLQVVGICLALVAVVIISWPDTAGPSSRRALGLAVVAGVGFASFFVGGDQAQAAGAGPGWTFLVVRVAGLAITLPLLAVTRPARPPASVLPLLLVTGLGDALGTLLFLLANVQGALAIAAVLASLYPVTTVVLARLVLAERLRPAKLSGVALAALGVVLLAA